MDLKKRANTTVDFKVPAHYCFSMVSLTPSFRNHLFSFEAAELAMHKNLMTCVIFGRTQPVLVTNGQLELEADIVCIKPDIFHRVSIREGGAEIMYLDGISLPDSTDIFEHIDISKKHMPDALKMDNHQAVTDFRRELEGERLLPDPIIMEIVEQLYTGSHERMSQEVLSQKLGLERTQALRHFKRNTGQTFRKFKIWAAVLTAAHNAFSGEQIGLAGADAGFSDAAHTARTAMATFGMTPTMGLKRLTMMSTFS